MEKVRLRAPVRHGEALFRPRVDSHVLFEKNLRQTASIGGELAAIRKLARAEIVAAAWDYSQSYSDAPGSGVDDTRIVMSGHQPTLFHPGVWLKNFSLANVAAKADAIAINLVVDNDLCQSAALNLPVVSKNQVGLERISFDRPDVEMPFELRTIQDRELFRSFGESVARKIKPVVLEPLIDRLWPKVIEASVGVGGLGAAIAAGRHLLEQEHGLRTLELPISRMAGFTSFARFFAMISTQAIGFADTYNEALFEYREMHGIRSSSHPVPVLVRKDDWQEIPFWCWTAESQRRGRVFARCFGDVVELWDLERWNVKVPLSDLQSGSLAAVVPGVSIRPRALMTTMFSRLLGCDLFIHGIGGSKYDQVTERIVQKFFGVSLPTHLTCTATMQLPFSLQATTREDVVVLEQQLREMKFHPEKFLGEEAKGLKVAKQVLLAEMPEGGRKKWHDEMERANREMGALLVEERRGLVNRLKDAKSALPSGRLIGSREYAFPLFPESLVEALVLSTEY